MKRSLSQRAAGPGGRAAGRQAVVDVEDHGLAPKRIKAEVPTLSGPLREERAGLSADGEHFYNICQQKARAGHFGATQEQLQAAFTHLSESAFGQLINDLLNGEHIEVKHAQSPDQTTPVLLFCPIDEEDQARKANLTSEERVCYDLIKDSGNLGIWVKDVIRASNLHRQVVTKCISKLETRKIIKGVKPVKNPTKKVYMLYDTDPSTEVTGGAWYTDQELDQEYVSQITKFVLHWIRSRTSPQPNVLSDRRKVVTAAQVQVALEESAISQMPLSESDVRTLLLMCVYDGTLDRMPGAPESFRIASRAPPHAAAMSGHTGAKQGWSDHITAAPCGVCPVYKRCTEGAIINPQECHYFDAWLKGENQFGILSDP